MAINEVIIRVPDVQAAVDFYAGVCGFTHVRTVEQAGVTAAEMDAGGQRISLVYSAKPGIQLALDTDDIESERRRLERRDVSVGETASAEEIGGSWLAFTDPWGNRLGYWQPDADEE